MSNQNPSGRQTKQREYYRDTADQYDDLHFNGSDHHRALNEVAEWLRKNNVRRILDVGSGTCRVARYFRDQSDGFRAEVVSVDPVRELLEEGVKAGVGRNLMVQGSGYELPFQVNSVEAVVETGVLHHVEEPGRFVEEMIRVSSRFVFISDSNRFGQGSLLKRLIKIALYKTNLIGVVDYMKTGGKGYHYTEGDGVSYPFSIFEIYPTLKERCRRTHVIPLDSSGEKGAVTGRPILGASSILLAAEL